MQEEYQRTLLVLGSLSLFSVGCVASYFFNRSQNREAQPKYQAELDHITDLSELTTVINNEREAIAKALVRNNKRVENISLPGDENSQSIYEKLQEMQQTLWDSLSNYPPFCADNAYDEGYQKNFKTRFVSHHQAVTILAEAYQREFASFIQLMNDYLSNNRSTFSV